MINLKNVRFPKYMILRKRAQNPLDLTTIDDTIKNPFIISSNKDLGSWIATTTQTSTE